jgi:hypothetical protein
MQTIIPLQNNITIFKANNPFYVFDAICTTFAVSMLRCAAVNVDPYVFPASFNDDMNAYYSPDYAGPGSGDNTPRESAPWPAGDQNGDGVGAGRVAVMMS